MGFPGCSDSKESACNAGDLGSIPGSGRSPGEGNGNPRQCSCLENPMDRGAWWASVHATLLQSRPSLFTLLDYRPPVASVHGDSPGKDTRVGCHSLLQGIFPRQGWNPGHCRQILHHLSHQGRSLCLSAAVRGAAKCPTRLSRLACGQS